VSGKTDSQKRTTGIAIAVVLTLALALSLLAAGCGAQTPESAVRNFFAAIENHNWNGYLSAILPNNVRRMTDTDTREQKKGFLGNSFKYGGLKLNAKYDKKNKNKADVELTSGSFKVKNSQTGKEETTNVSKIKKQMGRAPALKTVKFKGCWYVDIPLAAKDTQQPSGM